MLSVVGAAARLGPAHRRVGLLGAVLAVLLGTAAFASLGLLMAGALRAEATLAAANLVYLLLLARRRGDAARRRRTARSATSPRGCPSGALGEAMREAFLDGTVAWRDLAVLLGWAAVGTRRHRADVLVGVSAPGPTAGCGRSPGRPWSPTSSSS